MNNFGNTIPKGSVWECPHCGYEWDTHEPDGSLAKTVCPCRLEEQSKIKAEPGASMHSAPLGGAE